MFTKTRVASVVHDGDGRFGEGFLTHPALGRRHDRRPKWPAAQSQAVKKNASQPVPILRTLRKSGC